MNAMQYTAVRQYNNTTQKAQLNSTIHFNNAIEVIY